MPDEVPMVTSCPLCLAPDEVASMVTVEIERAIPKGRAAIMICRTCARAVIKAVESCEPPLLSTLIYDTTPRAGAQFTSDTWSAAAAIYGAFGDDPSWLHSARLHEGEESNDA